MNLVLIDPKFMRNLSLLRQYVLNAPNALLVQQTILVAHRQAERLGHRVKVARDGYQRRVTSNRSIHTTNMASILGWPVGLKDSVSSSPAEADSANLLGAWGVTDGVNEAIDDGLGDSLAMLHKPWAKGSGHNGRVLGFIGNAEGLLCLEVRLHVVEEGDGEGVAFVDVGDVAVESGFRVFVGQEADVGEFPAEDWRTGALVTAIWQAREGVGRTVDEEDDGLGP